MTRQRRLTQALTAGLEATKRCYPTVLAKATGIHPVARSVYSKVLDRSVAGEYTVSFRDKEAAFNVDNEVQYRRATRVKRALMDPLVDELEPDDVLYYIGANVGSISCLAGQFLPEGNVIAFEPLPSNAAKLREHIRMNDINGDVYEYALSDQGGEIEMFAKPDEELQEAGHSPPMNPDRTTSSFWDDRGQAVTVDLRRGDDLVEELDVPSPTVLKMDIEGAELGALRGLEETLTQPSVRTLFIEVHAYLLADFGASTEEIEQVLREFGFTLERFDERRFDSGDGSSPGLYRLKATR